MQVQYEFNQRDLGHGLSGSLLHPVVAAAMVLTIVLMLWRPRKYGIVALICCTFLVPRGQEVLFLGAHFYVRQILVLAGFIRVAMDKFRIAGGLNTIDKLFLAWVFYRVFAATVTNWPGGTMEQLAFLMQAICGYFLFRYLLRSEKDIITAARALAVVAAILGASMLYEHRVAVNLFGTYLGGVPAIPLIRDGTARAQATFGHSILAGCFGATLIPLFVWLWKENRWFAVLGITGSTLMVFSTVSSTPLLAYVAGIFGLLLWPLRRSMRALRWGILFAVLGMSVLMNAPVWFVISHVDVVGGSGGYDRAFLLDTCFRHFWDWWLIGTNRMGSWGYDMWDMSDQFVAEAETGGLIALICFIVMIAKCFGRLGSLRKRVKPKQQWLFWCLGAVMLSHIFAYFGVAYWDQTQIWWFAFLAMISAATLQAATPSLKPSAVPVRAAIPLPELEEPAEETQAAVVFRETEKRLRPWGGPEL